jgi:hypothetical protein
MKKRKTMATATKKTPAKNGSSAKKAATKRSASRKSSSKKNKLGVKNSLVNNINAHKKQGNSKSKKKSTVSKKAYQNMEQNWGKDK